MFYFSALSVENKSATFQEKTEREEVRGREKSRMGKK